MKQKKWGDKMQEKKIGRWDARQTKNWETRCETKINGDGWQDLAWYMSLYVTMIRFSNPTIHDNHFYIRENDNNNFDLNNDASDECENKRTNLNLFNCLDLLEFTWRKHLTDRPTDGRMDKASYRDAWTHLKIHSGWGHLGIRRDILTQIQTRPGYPKLGLRP